MRAWMRVVACRAHSVLDISKATLDFESHSPLVSPSLLIVSDQGCPDLSKVVDLFGTSLERQSSFLRLNVVLGHAGHLLSLRVREVCLEFLLHGLGDGRVAVGLLEFGGSDERLLIVVFSDLALVYLGLGIALGKKN
jgi:hypothetical protein